MVTSHPVSHCVSRMTSTLPTSLLSRVLALTQQLSFSLPLATLRTMGASWSDSIDASITIQADAALVQSLLESAAKDPMYANPSTPCFSPHSSPTHSPSQSTASLSASSSEGQPDSPTAASSPLHSSTVRLLLPYVLDDTHTFHLVSGASGQVTLEQRELLSGVVVWLGRVCRAQWYQEMLEETRSGYEQWNEAIKRMAEEQQQQQRTALEAH